MMKLKKHPLGQRPAIDKKKDGDCPSHYFYKTIRLLGKPTRVHWQHLADVWADRERRTESIC